MLFLDYNVWQNRLKNFQIREREKKTENIEQKTRGYRMYNVYARGEEETRKHRVLNVHET